MKDTESQFNPEQVERYNFSSGPGAHVHPEGVLVKYSNYLKLLEMYRAKCAEVKG